MATVRCSCTNPATGTTYRLVVDGAAWRITKSQPMGDSCRLAHLRGVVGDETPDCTALNRLIAGTSGTAGASAPDAAFAWVVLRDLDRTAEVLLEVVRTATAVHDHGCPGFRAKSPVLRAQRNRAMATATEQMRRMAAMWAASGLSASPDAMPDWLRAAIDDQTAAP